MFIFIKQRNNVEATDAVEVERKYKTGRNVRITVQ
jgi:hypothetical protein